MKTMLIFIFHIENLLNLLFITISTRNQTDNRYSISVHYNVTQQANTFNCRLNDRNFSQC